MKPLAIKRKSLSPGQPRPHTLTQTLFPASQQNACLPITELRGPSFRPGSQDGPTSTEYVDPEIPPCLKESQLTQLPKHLQRV